MTKVHILLKKLGHIFGVVTTTNFKIYNDFRNGMMFLFHLFIRSVAKKLIIFKKNY